MKGIPPAIRKRKRYIAFRLIMDSDIEQWEESPNIPGIGGTGDINARGIALAVWQSLVSLFGDYYSGGAEIWVEEYNSGYGILRCSNDGLDKVKVALTLTNRINGCNVIPVILGISGNIRKCRSKYMEV